MQQGYEGLIVRPNVGYNFDTRSSLFKLKKMDTEDCTLVEVLPGEEGKKHAHHAGRVLIELPWGGTCKAGLKMTDAQRDELWANRKKFVGMTVEVAYQEKTVNQDNEPKLQFPVMIGFREDKS
jgi:ATP-dependent DNA ligase